MNEVHVRRGRPHALTAEVQARLIEGIRSGLFLTTACEMAGITTSCYYSWRRKARKGHPDAIEYREFFHRIERVSAQAEGDALEALRSGDGKSWRAAAWFLERRVPEHWGRRRR